MLAPAWGASLAFVGGISAAGSIADDAIDGKLQNKKQWTGALIKAGTKGILSAGTAGLLNRFDVANGAIGEISKPLMHIIKSEAAIGSSLIDLGVDSKLDPKINGWQESYTDQDGWHTIWHKGLVDKLFLKKAR